MTSRLALKRARSGPAQRSVDIALQGGGAHGAFTWGVLDVLLSDGRLRFSAISGASAGAMNAVVAASGQTTGGAAGATRALWKFWKDVNRAALRINPALGAFAPMADAMKVSAAWWSVLTGGHFDWRQDPSTGRAAQLALRDIVVEHVDFDALRSRSAPRLFVSATNPRTGTARIFRNEDLSADAVIASACLPISFPPITIDGEDYWDGGFSANPPLLPLIRESPCDDLLLVTLSPVTRPATPRSPSDISERVNELTFSQSLQKEMRGLALVQEALGPVLPDRASPLIRALHELRLHEIHDEETFSQLDQRSKMLPEWRLLLKLHAAGARAAEAWLDANFQHIGKRSSADLATRYV